MKLYQFFTGEPRFRQSPGLAEVYEQIQGGVRPAILPY